MPQDSPWRVPTKVHHAEELERSVQSALAAMITAEPTPEDVGDVMKRLGLANGELRPLDVVTKLSGNLRLNARRLVLATAGLLIFVMCAIASTDAWAQVATDLANPANEPQSISTVAESTEAAGVPIEEVGFARRVVLITHVTLLSLAIAGMVVAWLIAVGNCLRHQWSRKPSPRRTNQLERRSLQCCIVMYGIGVFLGCLWAQATWGRPWSWAPQETFALLTFAFAVLWLRSASPHFDTGREAKRQSLARASTATVAIGAIVLMLVLGNRYASSIDFHGFPSNVIPTVITGFFVSCVVLLWVSFWLSSRSSERASV